MKTKNKNITMSYTLHPRLQNKTDNWYITINYKDIEQLFDMTSDNACKHLGISKTSLKKICRHFNIQKWPYKRLNKNNTIKPAIPIKNTNDFKDLEINNDLRFLTGLNITDNPYELEKILCYFY
tara:strand:- start:480 stop:851 length:372 start_codon:yes stop_codon:yes gene_type:complete